MKMMKKMKKSMKILAAAVVVVVVEAAALVKVMGTGLVITNRRNKNKLIKV